MWAIAVLVFQASSHITSLLLFSSPDIVLFFLLFGLLPLSFLSVISHITPHMRMRVYLVSFGNKALEPPFSSQMAAFFSTVKSWFTNLDEASLNFYLYGIGYSQYYQSIYCRQLESFDSFLVPCPRSLTCKPVLYLGVSSVQIYLSPVSTSYSLLRGLSQHFLNLLGTLFFITFGTLNGFRDDDGAGLQQVAEMVFLFRFIHLFSFFLHASCFENFCLSLPFLVIFVFSSVFFCLT